MLRGPIHHHGRAGHEGLGAGAQHDARLQGARLQLEGYSGTL